MRTPRSSTNGTTVPNASAYTSANDLCHCSHSIASTDTVSHNEADSTCDSATIGDTLRISLVEYVKSAFHATVSSDVCISITHCKQLSII